MSDSDSALQSSVAHEEFVSRPDDRGDRVGGGAALPRTTAGMTRAGLGAPAAAESSEVPRIEAEPRTLRFTAAPGEESAPASTRLANVGSQPFRIEDLVLDDGERSGFVIYGIGSDIPPGEAVEVQVAFRPHPQKTTSDRLKVIGNRGAKAVAIALRGKVVTAEKAQDARASAIVAGARQWKYPSPPKTYGEMLDALAAASELMDGPEDQRPDPFDYTHARELSEPVVRELDEVASFERIADLKRKLELNGMTQQVVDARIGNAKLAARTFMERAILGGSINGEYTLNQFQAGREEILLLTGEKKPGGSELDRLDATSDVALKAHLAVAGAPLVAGAAAAAAPVVASEAGLLWYSGQQALTGVTTWALANPLVATELTAAAIGLGLDVAESGPQNFWSRLEDPQQFAFLAIQLFVDYASVKGAQSDWESAGAAPTVPRVDTGGDIRTMSPPRAPSGRPAGPEATTDAQPLDGHVSIPARTTIDRLRSLVELVADRRGLGRVGQERIGVHDSVGGAGGLSAVTETVTAIPPPLHAQIDQVTRVDKGAQYDVAMSDLRRMYGDMEREAGDVVRVTGLRSDGQHNWNYGNDAREFSHGVTAIEFRVHLDGGVNAVPSVEMARLKENVVAGVDRYYNFQHSVATTSGGVSRLHLEVSFVDDPSTAHLNVTVHRGDGFADLENWFTGGNPTTHAHEVGHGAFGLWDESVDYSATPNPWRATPSSPLVHHDASLMGNYWEGPALGPVIPETSLKPRHLEEVGGSIADARRSASGAKAAAQSAGSPPLAPGREEGSGDPSSATEIAQSVQRRISQEEKRRFELRYSTEEIGSLVERGRQLGLSDTVIEHMIFVGSRDAKAISASELMLQMENYATIIRPREFPYRFESRESFQSFEQELRTGLSAIGLPADDVRVQGSAMRTPAAKDVDVAVMLSDEAFDALLIKSFSGKARETGRAIDFPSNKAALVDLADKIERDHAIKGGAFNAFARTYAYAYRVRKMRPDDVRGLSELIARLEASFGAMDISVMSRNGNFDVEPFQVAE
jgi:hypothetical protein